MSIKAPSPPYLGPANHHGGHGNKPIHRVVIHCTVSRCVPGGARANARYFRNTSRYASAHYVADPREAVQVVWDSVVAYHAPPNEHSIGYELCDPQKFRARRWRGKNHRAMLEIAARDVARLCLAYEVPIRKIGPGDLRAGKRGICGHVDVSHAWHQTTHTDPGGGFPWDDFLRMVREAADDLRGNGDHPKRRAPAKPTRVDNAHEKLADALHILDRAVDNGRRGAVRKARDVIRHAKRRILPKH